METYRTEKEALELIRQYWRQSNSTANTFYSDTYGSTTAKAMRLALAEDALKAIESILKGQ